MPVNKHQNKSLLKRTPEMINAIRSDIKIGAMVYIATDASDTEVFEHIIRVKYPFEDKEEYQDYLNFIKNRMNARKIFTKAEEHKTV